MKCTRITALTSLSLWMVILAPDVSGQKSMDHKMKVEIWSDVVCPWCYIGKRKFEMALKDFPHADQVELEWKSYQLSPQSKTDPGKSINQYLAEAKHISPEEAQKLHEHVTQIAAGVGLDYHFDKVLVVNTFNAHRFLHHAKSKGKQAEAKERLCKAYFTEGKNTDDYETLIMIGKEIGLDADELRTVLNNGTYADKVRSDIEEGYRLGLRGVPFFVFNRKYGVSGAQDPAAFFKILEQAYEDFKLKSAD